MSAAGTTPAYLVDVVRGHTATLAAAGLQSPETDALALACHAFGLPSATILTAPATVAHPAARQRLTRLVARRAARVPLQHLTGDSGFRHLVLGCRPGVFVPRPETEVLTDVAIRRARDAVRRSGTALVAEPCTGTGAVALAIATEVAAVRVVGTDTSADAISLARANLERVRRQPGLAADASCEFRLGDLLTPLTDALVGHVDVLVANPPYLTPVEVAAAEPEVRDHDPTDALVGGPDGNAVTNRLLADGHSWLRPGGWLVLEVAETRASEVAARTFHAGYREASLTDDLTGRPRVLQARRPPR